MLKTKSVYSPIKPRQDGLRILTTRFRGRGMPTSRYHVWMPNLAPSETLLRGAQGGFELARYRLLKLVFRVTWSSDRLECWN